MHIMFCNRKGGVLGGLLILLFFIVTAGTPFVLYFYTDVFANADGQTSVYNPQRLSKLDSETRKEQDKLDSDPDERNQVEADSKPANFWDENYSELETLVSKIEKKEFVIESERIFADCFDFFNKTQMLENIANNPEQADKIDSEKLEKLKTFRKTLGDYLSEFKSVYIFKKIDEYVDNLDYEGALNYLKDVLETKLPYDMPKAFIDNKFSGVVKIEDKDKELENYLFENKTYINAKRDFLPVFVEYLEFTHKTAVYQPSDFNYPSALEFLHKLEKFNVIFVKKYTEPLKVKEVADEIQNSIRSLSSQILTNFNRQLIELSEIEDFKTSQAVISSLEKLEQDFVIINKYNPELNKQLWDSFREIKLRMVEPLTIYTLDKDEILNRFDELISAIDSSKTTIALTLDEISTSQNTLTKYVSNILEIMWLEKHFYADQSGKIKKLTDEAESIIFNLLYTAINSSRMDDRTFKRDSIAWCYVFMEIWKPGTSRFGNNMKKLLRSKELKFTTYENYSTVLSIVDSKLPAQENQNAYDFVRFSWDFRYVIHQSFSSDLVYEAIKRNNEFTTAYWNLMNSLRLQILKISKLDGVFEGDTLKSLLLAKLEKLRKIYEDVISYQFRKDPRKYQFLSEQKILAKFESILKE